MMMHDDDEEEEDDDDDDEEEEDDDDDDVDDDDVDDFPTIFLLDLTFGKFPNSATFTNSTSGAHSFGAFQLQDTHL